MIGRLYIILLLIINILEFKKIDKLTPDNLFYILSLDTLSLSLYVFLNVYKHYDISLINILAIIYLMIFYMKEKRSCFKTAFFLINLILIFKLLI